MPKSKKKRHISEAHTTEMLRRFAVAVADTSDDEDDCGARKPRKPSAYEAIYRGRVVPEGDWRTFVATMRRPLPVTLRLEEDTASGARLFARLVASGRQAPPGRAAAAATARPPAVVRVGGIPSAVALPFDKRALRSDPALRRLQEDLNREMALGALSRQELVSMLPAVLAGVEPGFRCAELCCCPGSKTRQILAMLRDGDGAGSGGGLLVANDSDALRVASLAAQFKGAGALTGGDPRLLLTNARGDDLCHAIASAVADAAANASGSASGDGHPSVCGLFDRVFVDVPCSGDGTFRKAPDLWRRWSPEHARGLAPLQAQLLAAAVVACKPGGIVCFSTCSLHPAEDEEVVAAAISRGGVELVDARARAETNGCTLIMRPGMPHTAKKGGKKAGGGGGTGNGGDAGAAPRSLPLERCVRVLPHDNDTGGFFVALLRRTTETPRDAPPPQSASSARGSVGGSSARVKGASGAALTPAESLDALHRVGFASAAPPAAPTATKRWRAPTPEEAVALTATCGLACGLNDGVGGGPGGSLVLVVDDAAPAAVTAGGRDRRGGVDARRSPVRKRVLLVSRAAAEAAMALPGFVACVAGGAEVATLTTTDDAASPRASVVTASLLPCAAALAMVELSRRAVKTSLQPFASLCRELLAAQTSAHTSTHAARHDGDHDCCGDGSDDQEDGDVGAAAKAMPVLGASSTAEGQASLEVEAALSLERAAALVPELRGMLRGMWRLGSGDFLLHAALPTEKRCAASGGAADGAVDVAGAAGTAEGSAVPGAKRRLSKAERKATKKAKAGGEEAGGNTAGGDAASKEWGSGVGSGVGAASSSSLMPYTLAVSVAGGSVAVRAPSQAFLRSAVEMASSDKRPYW